MLSNTSAFWPATQTMLGLPVPFDFSTNEQMRQLAVLACFDGPPVAFRPSLLDQLMRAAWAVPLDERATDQLIEEGLIRYAAVRANSQRDPLYERRKGPWREMRSRFGQGHPGPFRAVNLALREVALAGAQQPGLTAAAAWRARLSASMYGARGGATGMPGEFRQLVRQVPFGQDHLHMEVWQRLLAEIAALTMYKEPGA